MDSSFNLAAHALIYLAQQNRSLSSEELAENICTHPARVRRVLSGLKKSGLISTQEGPDGGYRLAADAAAITLDQVARAVGAQFVSCAWRSGDTDRDCAICSGMAGVMDRLYGDMNAQCLAYLSRITIEELRQALTQKTGGST